MAGFYRRDFAPTAAQVTHSACVRSFDEGQLVSAGVRIADERQRSRVGQMCIAAQVANDVCGKEPSLWVISRQEFDRAEPVLLILPVWLQILLAVRSQDRQISQFSDSLRQKLAVQGRYNLSLFFSVLSRSLQGFAERPLPCNCYVIQ